MLDIERSPGFHPEPTKDRFRILLHVAPINELRDDGQLRMDASLGDSLYIVIG
jgi:hypothetical protein